MTTEIELETRKITQGPKMLQNGWKFYEGYEVCSHDEWPPRLLCILEELKEDTLVLLVDAFGSAQVAKCIQDPKDNVCYAQDVNQSFATYILEFDKDDRHCWICTCTNHINDMTILDAELVNTVSIIEETLS